MMDDHDFTRGIQLNPIEICKKDYTLASGFVGVEILNEIMDPNHPTEFLQYVRPAIGWFLYEEDLTKTDTMETCFISAETSGSLF